MKKQPSNTIGQQVKMAQAALAGDLQPPSHISLRECDIPYWQSIVHARARENWLPIDLENAANLARAKADITRLQTAIEVEGDIIVNAKGTPIANPKHSLIETLTRRVMALSRMLHVHAEATSGPVRDEAKSNQQFKTAKDTIAKPALDLIAKPKLKAVG